jgi:hypothetical protein
MEVIKKLPPGSHGTKRYTERFGERLVCVRYRYDPRRQRRLTTVELIVDEGPLIPQAEAAIPHPNRHDFLHVAYTEATLRRKVKDAGGKWLPDKRLWKLPYHAVRSLGLQSRVVKP